MAVVKLKTGRYATAEEIQEYCKTQLSSYKKTRYVEFVDSFRLIRPGRFKNLSSANSIRDSAD
jgi:long-chain acyl-CoA synthetase